jgi:hypothetical protein
VYNGRRVVATTRHVRHGEPRGGARGQQRGQWLVGAGGVAQPQLACTGSGARVGGRGLSLGGT